MSLSYISRVLALCQHTLTIHALLRSRKTAKMCAQVLLVHPLVVQVCSIYSSPCEHRGRVIPPPNPSNWATQPGGLIPSRTLSWHCQVIFILILPGTSGSHEDYISSRLEPCRGWNRTKGLKSYLWDLFLTKSLSCFWNILRTIFLISVNDSQAVQFLEL